MLPARCPHCQAELPSAGTRFCGMCGQRVAGRRGRVGTPRDGTGTPSRGRSDGGDPHPEPGAARHQERGAMTESQGRDDEASTDEPRSKGRGPRVRTSPIGHHLPSEILDALGSAGARPERGSDEASRRRERSSGDESGRRRERSGRTELTARREHGVRPDSRPSRGRPERTSSPPARGRVPSPAALTGQRRQDDNAPTPIHHEPTEAVPGPVGGSIELRLLRAVLWTLLYLGLAIAAGYAVLSLLRHHAAPPPPPPPKSAPSMPPKPVKSPTTTTRLAAPRPAPPAPAARPGVPRTRDLIVTVPARLDGPAAATAPVSPAASAPVTATVPGSAPATPAALSVPSQPAPPTLPPLAPGDPLLQKTLDDVEFVASAHSAQVRACYERTLRGAELSPERGPGGRVELSFTLTAEGLAQGVVATENTLGSVQLAGCLVQRLSEWRFPRPQLPPGRSLPTLSYPFVFVPEVSHSGPRPKPAP